MDQIDSTQSGAFDERGVRILCRYPAETPADGFPAGDAGRFPAFVPEASEIAYEERKFRGGKVGPKLPDKGGKLSSVGRRGGVALGVRLSLVPEDAGEHARLCCETGAVDGIPVERRARTEEIDGGAAPSTRNKADH